MMDDDKQYEKFTKQLSKQFFTLNEVRKFIESDYVATISRDGADPKYPNFVKYSIKLVDGDVYHVYAKQ